MFILAGSFPAYDTQQSTSVVVECGQAKGVSDISDLVDKLILSSFMIFPFEIVPSGVICFTMI